MPRHPDQRPGSAFRPGRASRLGPGLAPAGTPASPVARRGRTRGDRGQVALEYIGFIPILLFVALCGIQLGWTAYVHEQADTAARTAARVEARKGSGGAAAGQAAVRGGLKATVDVTKNADAVTATVTIPINSIVPGLSVDPAKATAVMPNDDPKGP
ncbi:TadE/TadG family type IV pilus assembly protein [Streptomyces sp. NPDC096033]|uniref:TadE/TadG family type IV pilus assembly protein n=1 Tax=Streptomyces sp. NPDC096033 TaxID=3366071 RepID=UPI0037F656B1